MLEYDPGEYVFTALAGTRLAAIEAELARHGQYLPFNPPLAQYGATLGGTVAAGLSGAGRQRYGGLRDFFIGARFVDGQGRLVRSGGKVVKNAAGFDQHKLLIGSLGRLGALVELSFKVFPQPRTFGTLRVDVPDVRAGVAVLRKLATTRFDLEALDLCPPATHDDFSTVSGAAPGGGSAAVLIRLGGQAAVLPQRLQMLAASLGAGVVDPAAEAMWWAAGDSFSWLPPGLHAALAGHSSNHLLTSGWSLLKVPATLDRLEPLDDLLAASGAHRRYCSSGNLAWVVWPGNLEPLHRHLETLGLGGLVLAGATDTPLIGFRRGQNLATRIKATLDPFDKFLPLA
jgi:glycolate oxidase FAD binding subunit